MARKRGRKVTGRLIKRGRVFYLRWRVEGQEFSQRLTDAAGEPVLETARLFDESDAAGAAAIGAAGADLTGKWV